MPRVAGKYSRRISHECKVKEELSGIGTSNKAPVTELSGNLPFMKLLRKNDKNKLLFVLKDYRELAESALKFLDNKEMILKTVKQRKTQGPNGKPNNRRKKWHYYWTDPPNHPPYNLCNPTSQSLF